MTTNELTYHGLSNHNGMMDLLDSMTSRCFRVWQSGSGGSIMVYRNESKVMSATKMTGGNWSVYSIQGLIERK
jgi:hypothetical protein